MICRGCSQLIQEDADFVSLDVSAIFSSVSRRPDGASVQEKGFAHTKCFDEAWASVANDLKRQAAYVRYPVFT